MALPFHRMEIRSLSTKLHYQSTHHFDQEQIMGSASFWSPVAPPPPFAAQFAEVTVDIETGKVVVDRLVMAVDAGMIINPLTASGQIEGGMTQALGYAVCEEMRYDKNGKCSRNRSRWIITFSDPMKCQN